MISVVIPVYNAEKYLHRCIESILAQQFKDLELLLIDDGSSDDSGRICDEYATKDERVVVFHRKNSGASASRNFGIEHAKGHYVCFVDADDYVDADYISGMLAAVSNDDDADICLSGMKRDADGKISQMLCFERQVLQLSDLTSELFYRTILHRGPCCKLFRNEILNRQQIRFPEGISFGEDAVFYYQYLLCCKSIAYADNSSYYYVAHEGVSLSTRIHQPEQLVFHIKSRYELTQQLVEKNGLSIEFPEEFYVIKVNELKILLSAAFTYHRSISRCKKIMAEVIENTAFGVNTLHPKSLGNKVFLGLVKLDSSLAIAFLYAIWKSIKK